MNMPVIVSFVESGDWAMPKSITTGLAVDEHDVARLEVAVHDARRVNRHERGGQATGHGGKSRAGERAVGGDDVLERLAGHVPGHDVGRAALDVRVDDLGDVRAVHPAHGVDLAREPPPRRGLGGYALPEYLDRDLLVSGT